MYRRDMSPPGSRLLPPSVSLQPLCPARNPREQFEHPWALRERYRGQPALLIHLTVEVREDPALTSLRAWAQAPEKQLAFSAEGTSLSDRRTIFFILFEKRPPFRCSIAFQPRRVAARLSHCEILPRRL